MRYTYIGREILKIKVVFVGYVTCGNQSVVSIENIVLDSGMIDSLGEDPMQSSSVLKHAANSVLITIISDVSRKIHNMIYNEKASVKVIDMACGKIKFTKKERAFNTNFSSF